jgi:hypothetical protein
VSASTSPQPRGVDNYVDQVVRKEQFLAEHPDARISIHPDEPPHCHWRGLIPGCTAVTSGDLERLLDMLGDQVAARDAHIRWPNWTFLRSKGGWQAQEIAGPEVVFGRTIAEIVARIGQYERLTQPRPPIKP